MHHVEHGYKTNDKIESSFRVFVGDDKASRFFTVQSSQGASWEWGTEDFGPAAGHQYVHSYKSNYDDRFDWGHSSVKYPSHQNSSCESSAGKRIPSRSSLSRSRPVNPASRSYHWKITLVLFLVDWVKTCFLFFFHSRETTKIEVINWTRYEIEKMIRLVSLNSIFLSLFRKVTINESIISVCNNNTITWCALNWVMWNDILSFTLKFSTAPPRNIVFLFSQVRKSQ